MFGSPSASSRFSRSLARPQRRMNHKIPVLEHLRNEEVREEAREKAGCTDDVSNRNGGLLYVV